MISLGAIVICALVFVIGGKHYARELSRELSTR